jgi:hypothetical protein
MPKKFEINPQTKVNKIKTTLYNMIRASKKIDGRSFQKYINMVSGVKSKEENRQKLMNLYEAIVAIDKGEVKGTTKKLAELRNKKNEAASKIQQAFKKVLLNKKYYLIDVLLYRKPDEDDYKTKKKSNKKKQ